MKTAGTFSQNHLNLGIKTHLNGTLTSNIVIDTSQVAVDTTNRPKRPYRSGLRCADLGLADGARSADATLKDATEGSLRWVLEGLTPPALLLSTHYSPIAGLESPRGLYLEAVLRLCTRHQLRQLLARVEHARLHGRLVDANDFGNLLDRLAVVVSSLLPALASSSGGLGERLPSRVYS
jgi:hypothetical protein